MINDSYILWNKIVEIGKIDLKFYDKEIESDILTELNVTTRDLSSVLKNQNIRIEDFIVAFFVVLQPYSLMMSELLVFFETSKIKSTNDNLNIEIDFGKDFSKLNFDIKSFKNYISKWNEIEKSFLVRKWSFEYLWDLNRILRSSKHSDSHSELENWETVYENELTWPDFYPPYPNKVPLELDVEFKHAYKILRTVQKKSKAINPDRKKFWKMRWDQTKEEKESEKEKPWNLDTLSGIDHDRWALSFINGMHSRVKEYYQTAPDKRQEFVKSIKLEINNIFDKVDKIEKSITENIEEIFEFLDLPIWKQRHELYSVWVGIKTLSILQKRYPIRIHSVENNLTFSFSGTHLATVDNVLPNLHFWSELRSPLANPIGKFRKKAIQPDYSLLKDPVTNSKSSILEIECKQYKKASKQNFIAAVTDYANGRPNAQIVLVNYSSITNNIQNTIPKDLSSRITMIGNLNPKFQKQIDLLESTILESIDINYKKTNSIEVNDSVQFNEEVDIIEMIWEKGAKDLDLHLLFKNELTTFEINYNNKGVFNTYPFLSLSEDIQSGSGIESIKINKWLKGKYYISIHNYSKEPSLKESNAKLKVGKQTYLIDSAKGNNGHWWHVIKIDTNIDKIMIINEINNRRIKENAT